MFDFQFLAPLEDLETTLAPQDIVPPKLVTKKCIQNAGQEPEIQK
jgi:hypothetical protein